MKSIFKSLIVVSLVLGIVHNPALAAQSPSHEMTTSNDMDRNDNSSKWGLLGLLGLVGLIRMRKNERTGTYTTAGTPQNR